MQDQQEVDNQVDNSQDINKMERAELRKRNMQLLVNENARKT
jgi:hypothetical protein